MALLFSNAVGPIPVSVIETETHDSTIEISEIPIETGAKITDHAYRNPNKVSLAIKSAGAAVTYNALKALQESRQPFTLVTGLYIYKNMLIKSISAERSSMYSTVFNGTVDLQEAIIVGTTFVASQSNKNAGKAGGANSTNAATPTKANTANTNVGTPAERTVTSRRATQTVARGANNTTPITPASSGVSNAKQGSALYRMFN